MESILSIGKKRLDGLSPETVQINNSYEKIIIKHETGALELELIGKAMSRKGTLKEKGKHIADLTCH